MINWKKKQNVLIWGFVCGILFCIDQIFIESKIFNGKNNLWEDVSLFLISLFLPLFLVFIFYWPKRKETESKSDKLPALVKCPMCNIINELNEEQRESFQFICSNCGEKNNMNK